MVFEFTITKHEHFALISLSGSLIERSQAEALLEKAAELIQENNNRWAIDLEKLNYMNSSGLNTLIQLLTKARNAGGEAVLYHMNKKINELILITKLHTLFKIAENKDEVHAMLGLN
jgi:anti-sigma B factor antagonist